MRLGKEKATGYVEDTEADSLPAEEAVIAQAEEMPRAAAPEPSLPVS